MDVIFSDENAPGQAVKDWMVKAGCICTAENGLSSENFEVSVSFVSEGEIRALNKDYRGEDKVTDVLSFPQYVSLCDIPVNGKTTLGDVVICSDRALLQADEFGHSPLRELVYLFVHSVLHLLGHDHLTDWDKGKMRLIEKSVMKQIGLERME